MNRWTREAIGGTGVTIDGVRIDPGAIYIAPWLSDREILHRESFEEADGSLGWIGGRLYLSYSVFPLTEAERRGMVDIFVDDVLSLARRHFKFRGRDLPRALSALRRARWSDVTEDGRGFPRAKRAKS
jgi:hypothetical protein